MNDERRTTNDEQRQDSTCHSSIIHRRLSIVVGYGNQLRGDDAIGPRAAEAVAEWDVPGVRALAAHQLTPELAETLAAADLAIFVDALALDPADAASHPPPDVRSIAPASSMSALDHAGDPRVLLALAAARYGRSPPAWSIEVPAHQFTLGAALSPQAERGLQAALLQVRALLGR
jgi:hydrogenase maturation protease